MGVRVLSGSSVRIDDGALRRRLVRLVSDTVGGLAAEVIDVRGQGLELVVVVQRTVWQGARVGQLLILARLRAHDGLAEWSGRLASADHRSEEEKEHKDSSDYPTGENGVVAFGVNFVGHRERLSGCGEWFMRPNW